ncbi:MAG: hypothetical protein ACK55Z_18635 [bacterium]
MTTEDPVDSVCPVVTRASIELVLLRNAGSRAASESESDVHVVSECLDVSGDGAAGHVRHIADDVQDISATHVY